MRNDIALLHRGAQNALNKGDMHSLHKICSQILSIDERHADAWFLLSIVASVRGKLRRAIELTDRALTLMPTQSEYLSQKAKYHSLLRQDSFARAAAEKALLNAPHSALTLDTLGVVYTNLGEYQKARELLVNAVNLDQGNAQFHFNLATAEQFLGNTEAAKKHYLAAIKIHPKFYRAFWSLSELEKDHLDGSRINLLEDLLSDTRLRPEDELYLSHALSREYEQKQNYEKAFSILKKGKERRAIQLNYSSENDERIFNAVMAVFSKSPEQGKMNTLSRLGDGAIFIVGMPRTGTTLVERIVSSHSEVESLGELQNFGLSLRQNVESNSSALLDEDIIFSAIDADSEKVGKAYMASVANRRSDRRFFIDKLPLNFLYVGFILRCLPAAKVICLRRNPLDTCLSNYRQLFAINHSYYNYHYRLEDTARYYVNFHRLIEFWQNLYGSRLHQVCYEELTRKPEDVVASTLKYLELDWQQGCLDFHMNDNAVATPSATQVREKLYTKAVGRWQKYEAELHEAKRIFGECGISCV